MLVTRIYLILGLMGILLKNKLINWREETNGGTRFFLLCITASLAFYMFLPLSLVSSEQFIQLVNNPIELINAYILFTVAFGSICGLGLSICSSKITRTLV